MVGPDTRYFSVFQSLALRTLGLAATNLYKISHYVYIATSVFVLEFGDL